MCILSALFVHYCSPGQRNLTHVSHATPCFPISIAHHALSENRSEAAGAHKPWCCFRLTGQISLATSVNTVKRHCKSHRYDMVSNTSHWNLTPHSRHAPRVARLLHTFFSCTAAGYDGAAGIWVQAIHP